MPRRCGKCGGKLDPDAIAHVCLEEAVPTPPAVEAIAASAAGDYESAPPVAPAPDREGQIEPALTPEQWGDWPQWGQNQGSHLPNYFPTRHGIAAANLFGEPFGFDIQDVLDEVAAAEMFAIAASLDGPDPEELRRRSQRALSRARRLRALLPPIEGVDT